MSHQGPSMTDTFLDLECVWEVRGGVN